MAAFELAVSQGADAFELDVRLTADGVPVVLHDATLDRTTDRRGLLARLSLAELREVDAGARFTPDRGRTFPFRAAEVRVPTLAEVLRAFLEMPLLVEVKEPAAQEAVRRVLIEESAVERCVLASEQHEALRVFREPPFAVAASSAEIGALYGGCCSGECRARLGTVPCRSRCVIADCRCRPGGSWPLRAGSAAQCTCGR
jgi:glycerophosphoryl diester phosphodiesterase